MEDYSAYTDEELIMRIHNDKNDHGDNNEIMDYILEKYKPLVRKKTNALYLIGGENDDLILLFNQVANRIFLFCHK